MLALHRAVAAELLADIWHQLPVMYVSHLECFSPVAPLAVANPTDIRWNGRTTQQNQVNLQTSELQYSGGCF